VARGAWRVARGAWRVAGGGETFYYGVLEGFSCGFYGFWIFVSLPPDYIAVGSELL